MAGLRAELLISYRGEVVGIARPKTTPVPNTGVVFEA